MNRKEMITEVVKIMQSVGVKFPTTDTQEILRIVDSDFQWVEEYKLIDLLSKLPSINSIRDEVYNRVIVVLKSMNLMMVSPRVLVDLEVPTCLIRRNLFIMFEDWKFKAVSHPQGGKVFSESPDVRTILDMAKVLPQRLVNTLVSSLLCRVAGTYDDFRFLLTVEIPILSDYMRLVNERWDLGLDNVTISKYYESYEDITEFSSEAELGFKTTVCEKPLGTNKYVGIASLDFGSNFISLTPLEGLGNYYEEFWEISSMPDELTVESSWYGGSVVFSKRDLVKLLWDNIPYALFASADIIANSNRFYIEGATTPPHVPAEVPVEGVYLLRNTRDLENVVKSHSLN